MDALRLGPFVVPMQIALALGGILFAHIVAAWCRKVKGVDTEAILWTTILLGMVGARLGFVLRYHDLYLDAPSSVIDIRDGGFDKLTGFATAFVVGAVLSRRSPSLRRPLLASTLTGCVVFFAGMAINQALAPAGTPIPAVEVRRLDGSTVLLNTIVGRPLVINLWATWCPPCHREMPVLAAAQLAHPEVQFLFVNQGESAEVVARYLAANGLRMSNVVLDQDRRAGALSGSSGYPTTLFYDAQGRLYKRHMGELSRATLSEKIDQLLRAR